MSDDLENRISEHPCYNEAAHRKFARMHLPVAPACNIQCNYCNRKYDCSNESRPGVTSEVLSPEQAVDKVRCVLEKIPELKVIGIAGPGDPMANENTFKTIDLIGKEFPDLTLCISTNGLALPGNAKRLYDLGVRFVTITMNAIDPEIGAKVYSHVIFDGKKYEGIEAAEVLISRQLIGLDECVSLGMIVKINIVMIPGINDNHIPKLVEHVKSKGAYTVNVLPLIPVEGTVFEKMSSPTPESRKNLMEQCESFGIKVMRHCKQCRADAIGMLGEDRSSEFTGCGSCSNMKPSVPGELNGTIAVASDDGENVNCGFGNAKTFYIFGPGISHRQLEIVKIDTVNKKDHREHIHSIVSALKGASVVAVSEIGSYPEKILTEAGVKVIVGKKKVTELFEELN